MKLLLTNLREAGKGVISLDAEQEYEKLTDNLGGCYIDLMSGKEICIDTTERLQKNTTGTMFPSST